MILSVSRRTDIPAFYSEWFMNRVRDDYVLVRNPMNTKQISRIPLNPDVVDFLVFWSKNPQPLIPYLPEIEAKYGKSFYFQYTINGYKTDVEPMLPDIRERIRSFQTIASLYGNKSTVWRYDPIFLSNQYTIEWHIKAFSWILEQLKGYTDTCVISFLDLYEKTKSNTKGLGIRPPLDSEIEVLLRSFSDIAQNSGIIIKTCAEGIDLSSFGIEHNSCIDQARIEAILGCKLKAKPDNQRKNCLCAECADIGQYNTCLHGCKYCYANFNPTVVSDSVASHDDRSPLLTGQLTDEKVTLYGKAKSLKSPIETITGVQESFLS